MQFLVAADADYVIADVTAALAGPDIEFTICREGRDVSRLVNERHYDAAVLDLQIGSMGAMAVTMALRLDESAGAAPHVKVLMLLDRKADVHLAKRSAAEAWLVKPVDALTLKRAVRAMLADPPATDDAATDEAEPPAEPPTDTESAEEDAPVAG